MTDAAGKSDGGVLDAHGFLNVLSRAQFLALLAGFAPLGAQTVTLEHAAGRVLAHALSAPEDLPRTARASMDGYAVRARDTFGASETNPAYADLVADLRIDWSGQEQALRLDSGQCARIPTGGALPEGADAVVMVEHTAVLGAGVMELRRAVAPGENIMLAGEDCRQGEGVLPAGRTLRASDVGLLAALGVTRIDVGKRPRVAIISTGDELVPPSAQPRPGQIRDVNAAALARLAEEAGAEPACLGIVPDDLPRLTQALKSALEAHDVVLLSGGSSLGARDHTCAAILAQPGAAMLAHGVAMSPGKPTMLARVSTPEGDKAVLGLPGQVTSAQVVMAVLVQPFLRHLAGQPIDPLAEDGASLPPLVAELARNLSGRPGREDFIRVRLQARPGQPPLAHPVLGKSGLLKTLLAADGLVAVPADAEGLYAGALVRVRPL